MVNVYLNDYINGMLYREYTPYCMSEDYPATSVTSVKGQAVTLLANESRDASHFLGFRLALDRSNA